MPKEISNMSVALSRMRLLVLTSLSPWYALLCIFPHMCLCIVILGLVDCQAAGLVASVTGQLIRGPTQTTCPATVRDTGGRLICPFCPLMIAVHCQLKSGAQFVCLGAHRLDQPHQTTSLFIQNHIICQDRSSTHVGKHKLFSVN